MLHNRKLAEHLTLIHFHHTLVNLVPVNCIGDAIEDLRMLEERTSFYFVNESNHAKVHVPIAISRVDISVSNRGRFDALVSAKLRRAKVERKEVVVIE